MRRFGFLLVLLLIGLSVTVPQLLAQDDAPAVTDTDSILQWVDSEPFEGTDLGLDMPIELFFDRPLNCATAGDAFSISPAVDGTLTCDETQLMFTADESFERASTYTVSLDTTLTGIDGAPLGQVETILFNTIGFLQIAETFPAGDTTSILLDTTITVIFNRAMIPLTFGSTDDELLAPLTFSPAVEGTGEWINTSIYLFTPDETLSADTTYTVTIAEDTASQDGAILPEDYSFSFTTQPPSILDFFPTPNQNRIALDRSIQMTFNLPMDQASVEDAFSLVPVMLDEEANATSDVAVYVEGESVAGTFEWSEEGDGFRFIPDELLELETRYRVNVDQGTIAALGSETTGVIGTTNWEFTTVLYPEIQETSPGDDGTTRAYGSVILYFSTDMDEENIEWSEFITIEPTPEFEPRYYWRSWSDSLEISFRQYASATYTVTVAPGLTDLYGNEITEEYSFSYTTEPFVPEVSLRVPGGIGFYNAERDPTGVFVTYRNADEFGVELYEVDLENFGDYAVRSSYFRYVSQDDFDINDSDLVTSWTVDGTDVPENALRFDLLEFDSNFGISRCPTSLPTRLLGAQEAVVISSPDPVRARQAPSTGAIVDLLYVDYQLTIAGDPVCGEEGLMWYPVELGDGTTAYVAESSEDEYLIAPPEGSNTTELQVADENGEGLDPGIYYLRIDARGNLGYNQAHVMVVANVNLTVKHTRDSMFVWATDVQTGEPVANLPVRFYGDDGDFNEIGAGITDEMGVLFLDVPIDENNNRRLAIVDDEATGYFGIGYSQWDSGISPWSFGQSYDYYPDDYTVYMYSDRPVYRPGQPVYIRGIVRSQDDISFTPPDIDDIYMYVANGFGDTIFEGNVDVNEFGTFSLELELAEDTQLGYYSAIAEAPVSEGNYWPPRGRVRFNVAEYRLPEFLVDVTPNTPEVVQGDTLSVTVDSTYFFGGSVSNATVEYSVVSTSYFFRYEGSRRYDFTDYNYDSGPSAFFATNDSGAIATGSATTDANGEFVIELPAELADASQSQTFTVEATVLDDTGQAVSGRGEVVVHQGEIYVGLRSESYVIRTGEESAINFVTVDWDSQPVSNQTVDYEVVERRWSSVQERDELGRTVWTYEVEEIPITDGQVTTDANGEAQFLFTPETGGSYKIYATTRDENGNEVRSSTFVWISSRTYVSWRQQNSNRIDLVSDAESYTVGDTAEILITSPFQGTAEALITVERGDVLTYDHVTMDSNSLVYELPIDASYAPNIYVSVMIVKGVDETNPVAAFRMGYIQFSVDPEQQQLNIDISSNVDRTSPQETVTYTVRTTDYQGNPVSAEVGVGVTDLAALSLAPDNSRPIFNHFYSDQRLAVRTTTPLTINTDQITQEVLDTVKGGGGGIVADGLIEIRGEFIDTPYWNPSIVTDENGEATFDVRLPDNLTTWRLDARAITLSEDGNLLVGQNTFDLLSTKPLLIRPVTPRFFVVDDEVVLSAVVNNNTESDQEAVVTLNYTGVTLLDDNASQVVSVPADGSVRVTWRVTVDDVETAQLSFVADAGNFTDGAVSGVSQDQDGTLPIYRYAPPEIGDVVGTAGVIDSADSRIETIYLPERMNIEEGTLTVQLEQSLAATTNDSLDYLSYRYYRYYYTTSIVSRFLPNIMSYRALESFDLVNPTLEENLETNVLLGIQSLIASQRPDGGWGWSPRSSSDPMTTAYVVLGLHEAREQGFAVPEFRLNRGLEYLDSNFYTITTNTVTWQSNRQAFMLYVLARAGAPDVARTEVLYRNRDNLSTYGKALLAETYWYIDPTDTSRSDVLLNDLLNSSITSAAGVHWEEPYYDYWNWNTNTRTTSMVLNAFVRLRPNSELIPNIVRYLMSQREADRWESRQETAWAVMALTNWMVESGELEPDYDYTVSVNGDSHLEGTADDSTVRDTRVLFVDVSELVQGEVNRLEINRTGTDDGNLYYSVYLTAYPRIEDLEPIDNGFTVSRTYSLQNDPEGTPITEANVGDIIEVRLTIVIPEGRHYVEVYDPLPAGAEGIDPGLQTNQRVGTRPSLNRTDPLRYGWGWWWFSDTQFRDEAVVLSASYLPAGTYEYVYTMRAGVEGTYNVMPPSARSEYFPDVYGRGSGSLFTVNPAQ